jgi:hypothetical protein
MMIVIVTLTRFSAAKKHDAKDEIPFQDEKPATRLDCKKNTRIRTNNKQNGNTEPELAYEDEAYVMYMTFCRLSGAAMKRMLSISATKPRIVHATSSAGVCSDGLVLCRSPRTSEGQGSRRRQVVVVFALLPKSRQKEKLENKVILEGFQSPELRKNSLKKLPDFLAFFSLVV